MKPLQQQGLQKHLEKTLKEKALRTVQRRCGVFATSWPLEFVLVAALASPCSLAACAFCSNLQDYSMCNPCVYSVEPLELQPLQQKGFQKHLENTLEKGALGTVQQL